ncbi:ZIP metal ion transporter family [Hibiscus syriacus]|uniref:ZIP metal ion transporter family n=1 Tax=Hibiscus syriacus TaxID=106335 RepID=A0A6A3D075_HIBSY|nr:protein RETICULATA-RELATED 3, chloroplastic-like [Hibiscus syriacus]KAE8734034.1 ZIP metal ion transporter family [Hibiscus syriacus]
MAAMARYRFSELTRQLPNTSDTRCLRSQPPRVVSFPQNRFQPSKICVPKLDSLCAGGGDGNHGVGDSGGGGRGDGDSHDDSWKGFGVLGLLLSGWRDRVTADPQFPFKVLMEELVGVSACVVGDMSTRPNFGLNELDFVFSTLVVGSILNFTLMYLLAPTASASSSSSNLPALFANCPPGHMFEPGAYALTNRLGTFVYKGALFAAVGFAAGLVGTAITNGLIKLRKKMDPNFETPNKPPPTLLNALTWAAHMGVSSNLRYQTLNGVEFLLAKGMPPLVFKSSVLVLRCLNNVVGGMSFVILARMTGSQSVKEKPPNMKMNKLMDGGDNLEPNRSTVR